MEILQAERAGIDQPGALSRAATGVADDDLGGEQGQRLGLSAAHQAHQLPDRFAPVQHGSRPVQHTADSGNRNTRLAGLFIVQALSERDYILSVLHERVKEG